MEVGLVSDAAALESLRESDFDAYSAYGEVVDNSLQAGARSVQIKLDYTQKGNAEPITRLAFGDDGSGMPKNVLHHCMQLGYSSRYNDRTGIGRFGVGVTLAAINQCKKVSLYSREQEGAWLYTYVDLDRIKAGAMKGIPEPVEKDPPDDLADLLSSSGTLMIWESYDRQPARASAILDDMRIWMGRTYRKFIWDGVKIIVNGEQVNAIDPLYNKTQETQFPHDPSAKLYDEMSFEWPVPVGDRIEGGPSKSEIRIRMSLLPEAFRPTQGSGNTREARDRSIHLNEGVSILRNGREVFYGPIPWWPGDPFKEIDRWWGCEIAFDAVLDRAFTVKNIKRGAVPTTQLKKAIHERITPTRKTALEEVREVWSKAKADADAKGADEGLDTGHGEAEGVAKKTKVPKSEIDKSKDLDDEARRLTEQLLKDADAELKARWHAKFKSQPFNIVEDEWRGPEFVETNHLGGSDVLRYNMRHQFFREVLKVREVLDEHNEELQYSARLAALIDLLLISFSKAEAMFDAGMELTAERLTEQLRMNWGHYLSSYLETWSKEAHDVI